MNINRIFTIVIIISLVALLICCKIIIDNGIIEKFYVKVDTDNQELLREMIEQNNIKIYGGLKRVGCRQELGEWTLYLEYENGKIQKEILDDGDCRELHNYIREYGSIEGGFAYSAIKPLLLIIILCVCYKILNLIYKKNKVKKVI